MEAPELADSGTEKKSLEILNGSLTRPAGNVNSTLLGIERRSSDQTGNASRTPAYSLRGVAMFLGLESKKAEKILRDAGIMPFALPFEKGKFYSASEVQPIIEKYQRRNAGTGGAK